MTAAWEMPAPHWAGPFGDPASGWVLYDPAPDELQDLAQTVMDWGVDVGDGKCADCGTVLGWTLHGDADERLEWTAPWLTVRADGPVALCEDCAE